MPFQKIQFVERSDHTAGSLVAFNTKPGTPLFLGEMSCHLSKDNTKLKQS